MSEIKEKYHRNCEPHDAEHCDINKHNNLEPGLDDCGHTVNSGPGMGVPAYEGNGETITVGAPKPSSANDDQDPTHGPGVG